MTSHLLPPDLFIEELFTPVRDRIKYYTKMIDSYNCHIFSIKLNSIKELITYWETLNAIIASNFQSQLESDIELWNVYLIFFVNDSLTREIKYKIEQDKYSSRKIVFDYKYYKEANENEDKLTNIIEKKIIRFTI